MKLYQPQLNCINIMPKHNERDFVCVEGARD